MRTARISIIFFSVMILVAPLIGQESKTNFYLRGAFYLDWFGAKYEGTDYFNQLSTRLKMELINRRGSGWTLQIDVRDRFRLSESRRNQFLLYNARLSFEKPGTPLYFSIGQMNLYDTAGTGQLLGGMGGYKFNEDWLVGGYFGWESSVYFNRLEGDYFKFGLFGRYLGSQGRRFTMSYNHVRYSGMTERQYIYAGTLYPINHMFVLYGNIEYELASNVTGSDRLSRIFLNARLDLTHAMDILAFYSSGRGLDYHRYILERSQDPTLYDTGLGRFYYSQHYGVRLSFKPVQTLRLSISRNESEQKDDNIRNHTWQFGVSAANILDSGFTIHGSYSSNRGEISESDSYYFGLSKDLGRVSLYASFSNTYNGVRFLQTGADPEIIHLDDYKTFSAQFFVPINRTFAASLEYEYFLQKDDNQHLLFFRLIIRK